MEEHKSDTTYEKRGSSNFNSNTINKQEDKIFLDLGWGLGSIDLDHPYVKEFGTLGYTMASFILALMIVFIQSYVAVLVIAIINVIFQITVFVYCVYKYYHPHHDNSNPRASIQRTVSMSVDSGNSPDSLITRSGSMSPVLAAEYAKSDLSAHKKKKKLREDKLKNKCSCFKPYHSFFASFDETFGREDDPVFLRPYFFRFHAVLYGVIASLLTLSVILSAGDSPLNICAASYAFDFIYGAWNPEWHKPTYAEHFQQHGELSCAYTLCIFEFCTIYWLWFIVFSLFDLYELKQEYYTRTTKIVRKAFQTFKTTKINDLYHRAETRIYANVKSKMQFAYNWQLILFLYILFYAVLIVRRYTDVALNTISFPVIFVSIIEASVIVNIIMTMFKGCQLCKYPLAISNVFGEPIYCQSSDDVMAWWQLRHIYLAYRQPIYISVVNPAVFQVFIWTIILPFWAVMSIIEDDKSGQAFWPYPVHFSITAILVTIILYVIKQFVASWEKSKSHIGMLQKEVIRMKVNNQDFEEINELIQLLSDHITQFDKPIHIGGIPMTGAVFALLRGGFSAAALAIASEIANASSKDNE
eukprot:734893_1